MNSTGRTYSSFDPPPSFITSSSLDLRLVEATFCLAFCNRDSRYSGVISSSESLSDSVSSEELDSEPEPEDEDTLLVGSGMAFPFPLSRAPRGIEG